MGKVIFGLLIAVIVWLLFFAKRKQKLQNKQTKSSTTSHATPSAELEQIVTCSRCGVNIPQSEAAQLTDSRFVCVNPAQCQPR